MNTNTLTFDQAIELLEITDISKLTADTLPKASRKAKKRWHPDKVIHQKDQTIIDEYTAKFKQIELAEEMILDFLHGTYQAGEAFESKKNDFNDEQPEDIIRENAPDIQNTLKNLWAYIKEKKYKYTLKKVELSNGFVLKELLDEDFKDDISSLAIISLFYGMLGIGILMGIGGMIYEPIAYVFAIVAFIHFLSCVISFLPLSRFWLPEKLVNFMLLFVNYGLRIYYSIYRMTENGNAWLHLLVVLPELIAKVVKYVVLFPLYGIAKLFVKDKVVGIVTAEVSYYAEAAEWYVDELLNKNPTEMTTEELYHLSYLYGELSDVKSKV